MIKYYIDLFVNGWVRLSQDYEDELKCRSQYYLLTERNKDLKYRMIKIEETELIP